ncbi:MAG: protein translocase subunit SecD [Lachnospiraceae bacterium]
MKKKNAICILIITAVVFVLFAFTMIVGLGPTHTGSLKNVKLGLDLSGGVSIVYQAKDANPTSEEMDDTVYKLQQRVDERSTEANVYKEGSNRIRVEIPGEKDATSVLEDLGTPGSLTFQDSEGNVLLEGTDVADAEGVVSSDSTTGSNQYVVSLKLTSEGAQKFAEATAANVGQQISIVYDGETISSPSVNEAITGGSAQITGMSSIEEAKSLATSIRIGSLSLELEELSHSVVAAQLGIDAISTSILAGIIALLIIIIFMISVYRVPGAVASFALLFYTSMTMITINAFDITVTLPGIAGIILTIGMAVDANVIIYARIKEEIANGLSVHAAINSGFKKAFSAIFDGNMSTFITALILMAFGSGTVKGFAQTLALGTVLSMITALFLSRVLMNALYAVGVRDEKFYGRAKPRKTIDFIGKRKIFYIISVVLILCAPVAMIANGAGGGQALNYGLEFSGGTSTTVTFNEDYTIQQLDDEVLPVIADAIGDTNVQPQKIVDSNSVVFKTARLTSAESDQLASALEEEYGVDTSLITTESISSTISSEMQRSAIIAIVIATFFIMLYLWFRFKDIFYAGSAVLALLHDVLVVLGLYAIVRISVGSTFIAVMLTVFGYCINATIVIFDRIRENVKSMSKSDSLREVVNDSITQTLTRTIYTTFTTFIMLLVLYILGVSAIREFALPLIVGIVCGAYSSVCITGNLWYMFEQKFSKKRKK